MRRRRHPSTRAAGNVWGLSEADIGARIGVGEPSVRPQIFPVKPPASGTRSSANDLYEIAIRESTNHPLGNSIRALPGLSFLRRR